MSLTPEQVQIVRRTFGPMLEDHGDEITTVFYKLVMTEAPIMNNIFNVAHQANGHQAHAVADALRAYTAHIDDLGTLDPAFKKICSIHASMYVKPYQYDIVGRYIVRAMDAVLGASFTTEIRDAWQAAYRQLADIFIKNEAELYAAVKQDAWSDWRDFVIVNKIKESDEITSFYLRPADGGSLPNFHPGQFITVQMRVPAIDFVQSRQYSLSDAPNGESYRISVKRERGADPALPGHVSNVLHAQKQVGDTIRVSHPRGEFFLPPDPDDDAAGAPPPHGGGGPVVLLAAGVGITPLLSMLGHLLAKQQQQQQQQPKQPKQPLTLVHGARSVPARAFHARLSGLAAAHDNLRYVSFVKDPRPGVDVAGRDYAYEGRVELGRLDREKDLRLRGGPDGAEDADGDAQYYVCGPAGFMAEMEKGLRGMGVGEGRIHKEVFGPGEWPRRERDE